MWSLTNRHGLPDNSVLETFICTTIEETMNMSGFNWQALSKTLRSQLSLKAIHSSYDEDYEPSLYDTNPQFDNTGDSELLFEPILPLR